MNVERAFQGTKVNVIEKYHYYRLRLKMIIYNVISWLRRGHQFNNSRSKITFALSLTLNFVDSVRYDKPLLFISGKLHIRYHVGVKCRQQLQPQQ